MMDNLHKMQLFFANDLRIKEAMVSCAPDYRYALSEDYLIDYYKTISFNLKKIKRLILNTLDDFSYDDYIKEYVISLFNAYEKNLLLIDYDFDNLCQFYQNVLSNMNINLIEEVSTKCFGDSIEDYRDLVTKCTSVNELLHVIHSNIVNDEKIYETMPVIDKRINQEDTPIMLCGNENNIARKIYEGFPDNTESCYIYILSFDEKILIMARDIGHALMIEVTLKSENTEIRYYIPKVCNVAMTNKLKGVTPVTKIGQYTNGAFDCPVEEAATSILDIIKNTPCDEHINIEENEIVQNKAMLL